MSEGRGHKVVEGRRLVWYAQAPDEAHWERHWADKVRLDYYEGAWGADLRQQELGSVLLDTFPPDARILEAGCGAGWYVAALEGAGYSVDGIEFSAALVARISAVVPELPVRWADATALDTPDGSYDAYLSIGVMEHVREGPEAFLLEAVRLLTPGGRAIITVPAFGPLRRLKGRFRRSSGQAPTDPFYQYGFRREDFAAHVADAGFVIDRVEYRGLHRMLTEESAPYRWLSGRRGGERLVRRGLERLVGTRDGHMVLVVATRPASGASVADR